MNFKSINFYELYHQFFSQYINVKYTKSNVFFFFKIFFLVGYAFQQDSVTFKNRSHNLSVWRCRSMVLSSHWWAKTSILIFPAPRQWAEQWNLESKCKNLSFSLGSSRCSIPDPNGRMSFDQRRKRAGRRAAARAAGWRSWRTSPTRTARVARASTPTRSTTSACTSPAGSAPSCPKRRWGWKRSHGTPTPTLAPGERPASAASAVGPRGALRSAKIPSF